jgi:orotate phosphoribosyltransferase
MKQEDVLKILGDSGALLEGHFELRSGLHSARYFQCANVLRFPRLAEKLCAALVDKMRRELPAGISTDGVIAPAMGGIAVGHEMARAMNTKFIFAEKEKAGDGDATVLALRRFHISKGERFVVAEDVITRGGRVQETIDIVERNGGRVVAIGTLVNRSGGKASFKHPMISLIEIEPVTFEPDKCPLCAKGAALMHPGS